MHTSSILATQQLTKSILNGTDSLLILNGIDLSIQPSESIAILGVSGSGKSTLLSLLAGLDIASAGEVYLLGQPLSQLDEDGRAQLRLGQVGFIFQAFHLVPSLTALENIMLPLELMDHKFAKTLAQQWLAQVGLAHRAQHYPHQLSGGEQQRIAIARAFATNPKLLFADEPTGNLDKNNAKQVIQLLQSVNQQQHTTLILVTHDESLAAICSRKLLLQDGKLHEVN
jgi:putative ABC transport system ATP-binding protein